jgi:Na+/H+-dicarboxylate symporter
MLLGLLLGLFVGPRSFLFEKETLFFPDSARARLRPAPDPSLPSLALRPGEALQARVVGEVVGVDGRAWLEVRVPADAFSKPRSAASSAASSKTSQAASQADGNLSKSSSGEGEKQARSWRTAFLPSAGAPPRVSGQGLEVMAWVRPVGRLFLRLIKMVIVPLVFVSLLLGVASLGDMGKLGRLGGATLGYFMGTTLVAITIGLLLANAIGPGRGMSPRDKEALCSAHVEDAQRAAEEEEASRRKGNLLDRIVDLVPEVPLHAATSQSPNMLQVIVFALFLGVGFLLVPASRAAPALAVFDSLNEVLIRVVVLVMGFAPWGVLALLADVTGSAGLAVLGALAAYSGVVVLALLLHGTIIYGLAVRLLGRYPLGRFFRGAREAQLIAFSTSSSSATLPVSIRVAEESLGVRSRTAGFVLPLGATINMDGTALYQGVAAVFIAQVFGMDLDLGQQLSVLLTALLASVGAAGVPGAGVVTLAMVLTSVGVPTAGIALILGVDRLLDMLRTTVNVTGDLSCAVFVDRLAGGAGAAPVEPQDVQEGR